MPAYPKYKTLFIEITKNASTSIINLLSEGQEQNPTHSTYSMLKSMLDFNGVDISEYYSFVISRNPYDRYCAGWEYMQEKMNWPLNFDETLEFLFDRVNRANGEPIKTVDADGNPIAEKVQSALNGQLQYWWDDAPPLLWPQHAFIADGETVHISNYFKLEELETNWSTIRTAIQTASGETLPETLPVMNTRTNPSNWEAFYEGAEGQVRANKIEQLYDRDFELFGYNKLVF